MLEYVSQDFGQYKVKRARRETKACRPRNGTRAVSISSVTSRRYRLRTRALTPCSAAKCWKHVPEPTHALDEFARLLKRGGKLILTAPFASLVHMAPYHYCTGFSRYWMSITCGPWFRHPRIDRETAIGSLIWSRAHAVGQHGKTVRQSNLAARLRVQLARCAVLSGSAAESARRHSACFGWHCVAAER